MPELPEVETTRRALEPHLLGQRVQQLHLHQHQLREPLQEALLKRFEGATLTALERRGKHLLLHSNRPQQSLHIHLGMSGSLRLARAGEALRAHEIWSLHTEQGWVLHYRDPRKFGHLALINPEALPPSLLQLGWEPLDDNFNAEVLYQLTRRKKSAIKIFIMNQKYVVGVGNIYAAEALFLSGIHPLRPAADITPEEALRLCANIKKVLQAALLRGGTTLKDFISPDGYRGYFVQELKVYGRGGKPCPACGKALSESVIGGRSSVYCAHCQI